MELTEGATYWVCYDNVNGDKRFIITDDVKKCYHNRILGFFEVEDFDLKVTISSPYPPYDFAILNDEEIV